MDFAEGLPSSRLPLLSPVANSCLYAAASYEWIFMKLFGGVGPWDGPARFAEFTPAVFSLPFFFQNQEFQS